MAFSRCLICYNNLAKSCRETEQNPSQQLLTKDLHIIFILKTVFEVPSEKLEGYLVERGSPSSWNFIQFCERCENDVEYVKRIYQEILETSRVFTAVKKAIVTKVRQSWRKQVVVGGDRSDCSTEEISSRVIIEETRKFICEHDYGPSTDPFRDTDLLASRLYSFYEEEASQSETMFEADIEDEENSCDEYDDEEEESPNDEIEDGEWVVGEILPPDFAPSQSIPPPRTTTPSSNTLTRKQSPTSPSSTEDPPIVSSLPLLLSKSKCTAQITHGKRKQSQQKATSSLSFLQQQVPKASSPKTTSTSGQTGGNLSLHDKLKVVNLKPSKPMPPLKRIATTVSPPSPMLSKIKTENYSPHRKKSNKELHAPLSSFLQQQQTSNVPLISFQSQIKDDPATATTAASLAGFKCDYPECDRVFSKMCMLTDHKRRHTGERPFQCPWQGCTWKFIRKDELTRHYRIHTGDKPYKCPFCPKDFLRSDHRRKHVGSVHKVISQDLTVVQK